MGASKKVYPYFLERPVVVFDDVTGCLVVNGIRYGYSTFEALRCCGTPVGQSFQVQTCPPNGTMVLRRLYERDHLIIALGSNLPVLGHEGEALRCKVNTLLADGWK